MSDETPTDAPASPPIGPKAQVDVTTRLANLTARPAVSSIWSRRDAAQSPVADTPAADRGPVEASPSAGPASRASGAIGRLTRISASELWTDGAGMAAWVAANPDAIGETIGTEGLRFHAPDSGLVLGVGADGSAVCVVCEVGPSTDERLGVVLRIAAVQEGGTVIWLNGGPSDPHVAAFSWLNRATAPRFFLASVSGVRIDGSASAPLFDLVVRPPRTTGAGDEVAEAVGPTADAPQRRVEDHVPED